MIFEGSEKKCEVIVDKEKIALRSIDESFWRTLVSKCNATVLSKISNEHCDAYLLSESSLFVWDDHFLLITCGQTTLVDAVLYFLEQKGKDVLKQLIFQRKNEYFSYMQPTTFFDDVKKLKEHVDGEAFRFGHIDAHHNYLFHMNGEYTPDKDDKTYELLMYDICPLCINVLTKENQTQEVLRKFLALDQLIPGFEIDDFVFTPYGYSLNALKDDKYLTIHITPQEESSYISFEANFNLVEKINIPLEVLRPGSFDLITFNADDTKELSQFVPSVYTDKRRVQDELKCGYKVTFTHYYKHAQETQKPYKFKEL